MKEILVGLVFFLISSSVMASTIFIKNISESYSEKVKVSSSFFLGMQFEQRGELDKLNILFPDNSKGMLCIKISSIDGRYKAQIQHELTQLVSGMNRLDFLSKYQSELKSYKPNELAVKATIGQACSDNKAKTLIAAWSNNSEKQNVIILIRSDARKDVVYIPSLSKGFKCKKFKDEYKVTYDKYCELTSIDLTKVNYIVIKRKNLQKMPDEIIKLGYINEE